MKLKQTLRTIDLAKAVGISVQQVRNYERWGMLPPAERGQNGYRRYHSRHLRALQTARVMIAGFGWEPTLRIMRHIHGGDLPAALAIVDARHADLDRERREVQETLGLLREAGALIDYQRARVAAALHERTIAINEAASRVGVRESAVRFWERQGLLQPARNPHSGYRRYDEEQLRRLQFVAQLRKAGYGFDAIRAILAQLAGGRPERAVVAAEQRLKDISAASRRCAQATAALWEYVVEGEAS